MPYLRFPPKLGGLTGASSGVDGAVTTSAQTLTAAQQAQARANIGYQYGSITTNQAWANSETYADMAFTLDTGGTAAGPTLAPNVSYLVRASATFGDGTGKTPKFTFVLTGSTVRSGRVSSIADSYFNANDAVLNPITAATNREVVFNQGGDGDGTVTWDFIIDAGATGGVLAFQFAKSAASSAAGNVRGAFFECLRLS